MLYSQKQLVGKKKKKKKKKQLVGNLDISLKEVIYVTAIQDGQRHGDFLFITVALPGSLEVAKALPGSSEHFLTWLDLVPPVHV